MEHFVYIIKKYVLKGEYVIHRLAFGYLRVIFCWYLRNRNKATMYPPLWGWIAWPFIHLVALQYDEYAPPAKSVGSNELEQKRYEQEIKQYKHIRKQYQTWFLTLPYVLPCGACGAHALHYMSKNPPPFHANVPETAPEVKSSAEDANDTADQSSASLLEVWMQKYPPPLETSTSHHSNMFKWTVDFHNMVNKHNRKREWTEKEVRNMINERFRNKRNIMDIHWANEKRIEDHAYIKTLQEALRAQNLEVPEQPETKVGTQDHAVHAHTPQNETKAISPINITAIVLGVAVCFIMLIGIVYVIIQRRRSRSIKLT